jgi:sialic acid synthase SpsE
MLQIILDFGSGNTCKNDLEYIHRMIDVLAFVVQKKQRPIDKQYNDVSYFDQWAGLKEIIIKWQLFEAAGTNLPLTQDSFASAYEYGVSKGFRVTSSVFDEASLRFLLQFNIPFVKIANNRKLDYLIDLIPKEIPVYTSYGRKADLIEHLGDSNIPLACVSEYPVNIEKYEQEFGSMLLRKAVSDHTPGLELYKKYQPDIWEKHYKLSDSVGLDAGPFAITPEELEEIL